MTNFKQSIALAILAVIVCVPAFGATYTEIDFSDWDASILSTDGGSQVFTDVCGDLDVTVTAGGEFDATTHYVSTSGGGGNAISSQHDPGVGSSNSHSFTFAFSDAVNIIIETMTLDGQEQYVIAGNSPNYTNLSGAVPGVTTAAGSVTLDGVGFGFDPVTGSSFGETSLTNTNSVTVTYNASPGNGSKFSSFRVFKATATVPEPNSAGLLAIGGLALLGGRRRRR